MRTSNKKIIREEEKFDYLYPKYLSILDRLNNEYPVIDGSNFENLVNFKTNKTSPKHGWYNYKQGYGELLIKSIIEREKLSRNDFILDPFCGVGTTNLTAQSLGYKSIGFDINPMAVFATKIKTHYFSKEEIKEIEMRLNSFILPDKAVRIENSKVVDTSFTPDVLDILLKIRTYADSIVNEFVSGLFRFALLSIIDDCSLKVKDGNGLKIKKNYKPILNLVSHYLDKTKRMLDDIQIANYDTECQAIYGSMINEETFNRIKDRKVGLCVFSPPYANCFDYCEVYKLELWLGGFVKKYDDFQRYRTLALRSHVNSKFDHTIKNPSVDVDIVSEIVSTFNIWNKNIPDMLRGYFDDMKGLLHNLYKVIIPGAKCYIVVANSGYKGILVPTDLLLADAANDLGYKVNSIYRARTIRSSSQQMKILNSDYDDLMRETVLELQK